MWTCSFSFFFGGSKKPTSPNAGLGRRRRQRRKSRTVRMARASIWSWSLAMSVTPAAVRTPPLHAHTDSVAISIAIPAVRLFPQSKDCCSLSDLAELVEWHCSSSLRLVSDDDLSTAIRFHDGNWIIVVATVAASSASAPTLLLDGDCTWFCGWVWIGGALTSARLPRFLSRRRFGHRGAVLFRSMMFEIWLE